MGVKFKSVVIDTQSILGPYINDIHMQYGLVMTEVERCNTIRQIINDCIKVYDTPSTTPHDCWKDALNVGYSDDGYDDSFDLPYDLYLECFNIANAAINNIRSMMPEYDVRFITAQSKYTATILLTRKSYAY